MVSMAVQAGQRTPSSSRTELSAGLAFATQSALDSSAEANAAKYSRAVELELEPADTAPRSGQSCTTSCGQSGHSILHVRSWKDSLQASDERRDLLLLHGSFPGRRRPNCEGGAASPAARTMYCGLAAQLKIVKGTSGQSDGFVRYVA